MKITSKSHIIHNTFENVSPIGLWYYVFDINEWYKIIAFDSHNCIVDVIITEKSLLEFNRLYYTKGKRYFFSYKNENKYV